MEYNKAVTNPMLVGAMELAKAENTPAHRQMVTSEMVKAKYITPAVVTPAPEPNEKGEALIESGTHVQLPVLAAPDGKQFFMAFTDMAELKKWKDEEGQQTVTMTFEEYAAMLFRKDSQGNMSTIAGFVINPFSMNVVVPREMVEQYVAARMAQERAQAEKAKATPPEQQI